MQCRRLTRLALRPQLAAFRPANNEFRPGNGDDLPRVFPADDDQFHFHGRTGKLRRHPLCQNVANM